MASRVLSGQRLDEQLHYCVRIGDIYQGKNIEQKAYLLTFGCQQNEADTELLRGMLSHMGFSFVTEAEKADVIVINSCAIREHAEMRAFGNVGELSHLKRRKKDLVIVFCGCMAQQEHVMDKLKKSFPYVDIVMGTHALARFPELLFKHLTLKKRVFDISGEQEGVIIEGIDPIRDREVKAWLSIMYGCNNYCSYCVVPYVRGRERSREPEVIIAEFKKLLKAGYKDITLLGQNVNSYGKTLDEPCDFAELLQRLNDIPGDFRIRFMTSHPKDASRRLFDTMAACEKVAKVIHLPVQCGSDRVLMMMNRGYTAEKYKDLIAYARKKMPQIVFTSDIIVGFPGETEKEFCETLALCESVRFDSLFTFIYSRRAGTKAAELIDPVTREEKQVWFDRLLNLQNKISKEINEGYVGKICRVLVDGLSDSPGYNLSARTEGFKLVHLNGPPELIGQFIDVKIEKCSTWALFASV